MKARTWVVTLCIVGSVMIQAITGPVRAADDPVVACIPDVPVVAKGAQVKLSAWTTLNHPPVRTHWEVSGGTVEQSDKTSIWSFGGVTPGLYTASATLTDSSGAAARCSVKVFVSEGNRGETPLRETGRSYMLPNQPEASGYGLYSYLLFGSPPLKSTKARYITVAGTYLKQLQSIEELSQYRRRASLNLALIPLKSKPPKGVTPVWVVDNYDYTRARVLLDKLADKRRSGLYLLSSLEPLGNLDVLKSKYLLQDLSTIPPKRDDVAAWWIEAFLSQAAQEDFYEPRTLTQVALKIRTTLAVLAIGVPEVHGAIDTVVAWVK